MLNQLSPLDYVKRGDLNYFRTVASDVLENYRDEYGDTILSRAALENQIECCKEIYRRCPSLLYIINTSYRDTILHDISYYNGGMIQMLDFFVQAAAAVEEGDLESGDNLGFKKWMELQNIHNQTAMCKGFRNRETVKWWIQASRDYNLSILRKTDNKKNTPLHVAVMNQDLEIVELLLAAEPEFEYTANIDGETPLSIAMEDPFKGKIRNVILERQPKQSMVPTGEKGWTSLHTAAFKGELTDISDIIRLCPNCTKVLDNEGQNFLHVAVEFQQLNVVKHVLRENKVEASVWNQNNRNSKSPLRMINQDRNTLLHLAVGNKDLELVRLLIAVGPDVVYDPNNAQDTPLDIAMRQAPSDHNDSNNEDQDLVEIRKLLIAKLPSLCTVRKGLQRWTTLHTATHIGDVGAVEDILHYCPNCVELVDTEGRNFLHIDVEHKQFSVVKCILEAQGIPDDILNQSDNRGNTPLHTAALTGVKNTVESLLYDSRVGKTSTNATGQKVLDAITFDFDKEKAGVVGVRDRMNEKELKDQSDFDLVVCALIATVSFTAGITVPGGYITAGPDSGMALLSKSPSFEAFAISNNFALMFSLYAVFSHFCTRRLLRRKDIIFQLNVATYCTLAAIFAMMVAFITGSYAVLVVSSRLAIIVCVNSSCFFLFAFVALWKMVTQNKRPLVTPIKQVCCCP